MLIPETLIRRKGHSHAHICLRHTLNSREALGAYGLNHEYAAMMFSNNSSQEIDSIRRFPGLKDYSRSFGQPGQIRPFQKSAIDTHYIYSVCPSSGESLRSNVSFLLVDGGWPFIVYYFSSFVDFYLITGCHVAARWFVYLPSLFLSITSDSRQPPATEKSATRLINLFDHLVDKYSSDVVRHCHSSLPRSTTALTNYSPHICWAFLSDYASIYYIKKYGPPNDEIRYASMGRDFLSFDEYYDQDFFASCLPADCDDIFKYSISNNCFYLQPSSNFLTAEFCQFLITRSRIILERSTSSDDQRNISLLSGGSHFKILVNLRTDRRIWREQERGISWIISQLREFYPNLVVVFDGYSSYKNGEMPQNALDCIQRQEQLASLIALSSGIKSYISIIGRSFDAKIAFASYCDCYLLGYGAAIILPYIIGIPGVIHASAEHSIANKIESEAQALRQDNPIPKVISSKESLLSASEKNLILENKDLAHTPYYNESYSVEAADIFNSLLLIAKEVCPKV